MFKYFIVYPNSVKYLVIVIISAKQSSIILFMFKKKYSKNICVLFYQHLILVTSAWQSMALLYVDTPDKDFTAK